MTNYNSYQSWGMYNVWVAVVLASRRQTPRQQAVQNVSELLLSLYRQMALARYSRAAKDTSKL